MHDDDEFHNERAWLDAGTMRKDQPAAIAPPPTSTTPAAPARFLIDWVDQHHEGAQPADPAYPNGSAIDVALDAPRACRLELPWPAARCGLWVITCRECGYALALATAGRPDDPRTVRIPCRAGRHHALVEATQPAGQ